MTAVLLLLLLAPDAEFDKVDFGTSAARRVKLLKHENPGVRRRAAMLLAHAPADEAIAGLLVSLGDRNPTVRRAAAASLGALADERAVPFLARWVKEEPTPGVTAAMLLALGRCGGSYVARHVERFLDHPVREVRAAAASALGSLGDAGQRSALWSALRYEPDDPGFVVRAAVLDAFVRLGWTDDAKRAIEELEAAGGMRHWVSRVALVDAVGRVGLRSRAAWVRAQIESGLDPRVVAAAAGSLARLGLLDEVRELLDHASPVVRRAALVALQEAGDKSVVAAARALVRDDPDVNVRFEAVLVLDQAGDSLADSYLVDALRARDPVIWITALAALERRHKPSFGRDPDAWAGYLKKKR